MLNRELREIITRETDTEDHVIIVLPGMAMDDGEDIHANVQKVTYITGTDPADTILEAGGVYRMSTQELHAALTEQDAEGTVQIYWKVPGSHEYAYYDVRSADLPRAMWRNSTSRPVASGAVAGSRPA